jgi:phytoene synthase
MKAPAMSEQILSRLTDAGDVARASGIPVPPVEGKLLRPRVATGFLAETRLEDVGEAFWYGALAIQAVHEASLLHDDILDGAAFRRGQPTVAASAGVGPALVMGDHLLTGAYRLADRVGSPEFMSSFVYAVEQTVAGEILQGRSEGEWLDWDTYHRIVDGKSGALFGAAAALAATCSGKALALDRVVALGVRVGRMYQMVDDILDYCPGRETGKPAFQDLRQEKWTWPLSFTDLDRFGSTPEFVARQLYRERADGRTPIVEAFGHLAGEADTLARELREVLPGAVTIEAMLRAWVDLVQGSVDVEIARQASNPAASLTAQVGPTVPAAVLAEAAVRSRAEALSSQEQRSATFRDHARSFHFAARLFPARVRSDVADVYAFCRFTDDLVDDPERGVDATLRAPALAFWAASARRAYDGRSSGMPFLDHVMAVLRQREVPFRYVKDLLEGVGMDLSLRSYASLEELWRYTYGVAGSVGCLMTELFGVHDQETLDRAQALGDAMQLTNILRDVGEDLDRGRVYLPLDLMAEHGISVVELMEMRSGAQAVSSAYVAMTEKLLAEAEEKYELAFEAIPALPRFARGAIAVAARVYRGIHEEIRANGYDNLTRRAHTSRWTKMRLAATALRDLRRISHAHDLPATNRAARWASPVPSTLP